MDRLSIFTNETNEVTIKSEENNTLDNVIGELQGIIEEVKRLRKGHEENTWGLLDEEEEE